MAKELIKLPRVQGGCDHGGFVRMAAQNVPEALSTLDLSQGVRWAF